MFGRRFGRSALRRILGSLCAVGALVLAVPTSTAQDRGTQDYRVRVAAALSLGRSKPPSARRDLEIALKDPHPAVRAAAAAALGALGDPAAIPALRAASAREGTETVRRQMDSVAARLAPKVKKPKFVVAVGRLENRSGVTNASIVTTLRNSTRARIGKVPGVEMLAEGSDAGLEARSRGVPILYLDGSVTKLAKKTKPGELSYAAKVEYLIRKIPDHQLKGSMIGQAEAAADARSVRGAREDTQLQIDAVAAAVDSALSRAPTTFEAATKAN